MAFCKFSTKSNMEANTLVDNKFISEYLPYAPDICVKVYLYGLYLCMGDNLNNNIENFAKTLNISVEDVENCFLYWQEQNLVLVLNANPIEVRYLPVNERHFDKKFSKKKYANFNKQMEEIIAGRTLTMTEFYEYYDLLERFHIEPDALVMIAKYCTNLKGNNVGYSYILTVTKNWAYEGIKTTKDVEEKLKIHEAINSEVAEIIKLLGSKKQPDFMDKQMYLKWTKDLGFDKDVITFVALSFKKKGTIEKLNNKLEKYYELKLLSQVEIEAYEQNKKDLLSTAKMVTKQIGVYYENLENVIETYIVKWQNMGYGKDELNLISNFCFKNNTKTLQGMNDTIEKFYSLGLTTVESINQYFGEILDTDEKIKAILKGVGLSRSVTTWDRDFYRTWTFTWNFSADIIEYACSLSVGKSYPLNYVNKLLSDWLKLGVDTLEKAKAQKINLPDQKTKKADFEHRSYSSEQMNALFDNLNEVKWK